MSAPAPKPHGLKSGIGLVVANMVGAGVFLSTGFMAQTMRPGLILVAWVVGGVLAMAGARAYAEVARLVPHSGGEYRYLTTLMHPALGYLAGWASLLVGFSAPIAVDALAAGAFARAVVPWLEPRLVAAVLVVVLTLVHAVGLKSSARLQNALVALKVLLLLGFVAVALLFGTLTFPTWVPPTDAGTSATEFAQQLFWIAFAYSGWNAAIYAADEFQEPRRTIPRAMLWGCALVMGLYLVVNYVFVANLTPEQGTVVFNYSAFAGGSGQWDQVTLGQAVMAKLLGPGAAKVMSLVTLVIFVSAISAMTMIGPRVYAAMAKDGFLPRWLAGVEGKPPVGAVLLQGALALAVVFTNELRTALGNVGAILTLFAALTVAGLFRAALTAKTKEARPSVASLAAAAVYVGAAGLMLFYGFRGDWARVRDATSLRDVSGIPSVWLAVVSAAALGGWAVTRAVQRKQAAPPPPLPPR